MGDWLHSFVCDGHGIEHDVVVSVLGDSHKQCQQSIAKMIEVKVRIRPLGFNIVSLFGIEEESRTIVDSLHSWIITPGVCCTCQ